MRKLPTVEEVQKAYGVMADKYIELFAGLTWANEDDLALIDRHLLNRPGVVLDVGCGPGHHTDRLRSLNVDAIGIDLVPEFIDYARTTFTDGQYQLGSMAKLPAKDRSIDGVLAWFSLIHTPPEDLDDVLAELRRVLAPDGAFVVGFFENSELSTFAHKVTTAYYWPIDEFASRLQRAGFTEVERLQRPGIDKAGQRPVAAIAATAT